MGRKGNLTLCRSIIREVSDVVLSSLYKTAELVPVCLLLFRLFPFCLYFVSKSCISTTLKKMTFVYVKVTS